MNETLKKILGTVLSVIALVAFYLGGMAIGLDVSAYVVPVLAVVVVSLVVQYAQEWFGLNLTILKNEAVYSKVESALHWAEGKAVEKFKLEKVVATGKEKARSAAAKIMELLPGISEEKAYALIDEYFHEIRPQLEQKWLDVLDEMKAKAQIQKQAKTTK